jgi:tRNA(Ile)-lysidine synthase
MALKQRGYVLSYPQRNEIIKQKACVISDWVIVIDTLGIFICPYTQDIMPKEFKELCRENKIPKKIRSYLFKENTDIKQFNKLLLSFN